MYNEDRLRIKGGVCRLSYELDLQMARQVNVKCGYDFPLLFDSMRLYRHETGYSCELNVRLGHLRGQLENALLYEGGRNG